MKDANKYLAKEWESVPEACKSGYSISKMKDAAVTMAAVMEKYNGMQVLLKCLEKPCGAANP